MSELILPSPKSQRSLVLFALLNIPFLWYVKAPRRFLVFAKNITLVAEDRLTVTLMARFLFAPLFNDFSVMGRTIGFIYRVFRIAAGAAVLLVLESALLGLLVFHLLFPILSLYLAWKNPVFAPVFVFAVLSGWLLGYKNPRQRICEVAALPLVAVESVASPEALSYSRCDSGEFFLKVLDAPSVKKILKRLELESLKLSSLPSLQIFRDKRVWEIAFDTAREMGSDHIEAEHLFFAVLALSEMKVVLEENAVKPEDLKEVLRWLEEEKHWKKAGVLWDPHYEVLRYGGVGRAMLGTATPALESFGRDLTRLAAEGESVRLFGKEKILEKIAAVISRGAKNNVLLVGEPGSGKTTLVWGLASQIVRGAAEGAFLNKRVLELDISRLFAGTKTRGEIEERLSAIAAEIKRSGDIILFIDELHRIFSGDDDPDFVLAAFEPYLNNGSLRIVAADSWQDYRKFLANRKSLERVFEVVELTEAGLGDTLRVLEYSASRLEGSGEFLVSLKALYAAIKLSSRFIPGRALPDKAVDLLNDAVAALSQTKSGLIEEGDVAALVSEKVKIPLTEVTLEESQNLLRLEDKLHERVVNQHEAVSALSDALRRARVGIRNEKRPVASFLFIGPTGVGKTEMAKALSEVYFGGEEALVRFDMSEYKNPQSVERFLSSPVLEMLRQKPFSLVLLDEIEKAHSDILNLFLQVLEDGRLTDASGAVLNFSESIIIAASNVGSGLIYENLAKGFKMAAIKTQLEAEVRRVFRVEFLNRFDAVVFCDALSLDSVREIARRMLWRLEGSLAHKNIKLKFSDDFVNRLADEGYNAAEGARPLRRLIQDKVEAVLAKKMIDGSVKSGDTVDLDNLSV